MFSHPVVSDSGTPWTVAHQAPLSMGFFRQEYWRRLPFPPWYLPNPEIESASLVSPALQQNYLPATPSEKPIEFKYDAITWSFISCYKSYLYNINHNFMFIPSFSRYIIMILCIKINVVSYFNIFIYLLGNMHKSWECWRLCVNMTFTALAMME